MEPPSGTGLVTMNLKVKSDWAATFTESDSNDWSVIMPGFTVTQAFVFLDRIVSGALESHTCKSNPLSYWL